MLARCFNSHPLNGSICIAQKLAQASSDAEPQISVHRVVVLVLRAGPMVVRVEPGRAAAEVRGFPGVPWEDVRMQLSVGIAKDFVVHPGEAILRTRLFHRLAEKAHVQQDFRPIYLRQVVQPINAW